MSQDKYFKIMQNKPQAKARESSFELIRLIAQFMIVYYHIYLWFIYPNNDISINKAIWLPLHIGVPLFVMISGYWGIHISGRGMARLLGQLFVYTVPFLLINNYLQMGGGKRVY